MTTRGYLLVWAALLVLLAATVGVARLDLGALSLPAALLIAALKTALVLRYFMHLRGGPELNALFGVGGFAWVALLIGLVLADYWDR